MSYSLAMLINTVFRSVNIRSASIAFSRPVPDILLPPNGACRKAMLTALMPTMPDSRSAAKRSARLMSCVKTPAMSP